MSAAAVAYNRLVEADARAALEQARWLEDAFRQAGITFAGEPMRTCLRPHLVTRPQWEALRVSGRRLMEIAARVARQVFGGDVDALLAFLGTPEAQACCSEVHNGDPYQQQHTA